MNRMCKMLSLNTEHKTTNHDFNKGSLATRINNVNHIVLYAVNYCVLRVWNYSRHIYKPNITVVLLCVEIMN